eukprot:1157982-Pelagomonas_calceolata.AAC.7
MPFAAAAAAAAAAIPVAASPASGLRCHLHTSGGLDGPSSSLRACIAARTAPESRRWRAVPQECTATTMPYPSASAFWSSQIPHPLACRDRHTTAYPSFSDQRVLLWHCHQYHPMTLPKTF